MKRGFSIIVFLLVSSICMARGGIESEQLPQQQTAPEINSSFWTGGGENSPSVFVPDELDMAIRDASDYLNDNIPKGSMIVILNIQSDSAALSDYIIDELIANAVNDRIFMVVDRQQLDLIRAEQNFQLSGEVDDNLALSIGKFVGAQTIVSGRVRQLDDRYRMTIRALEVQTAQVQGQYNRNMLAGRTITALMRSVGTQSTPVRTASNGSSGTQVAPATTTGSSGTQDALATTTDSATVAVPGGIGALNVNSVSAWNTVVNRIRNGGDNQTYAINVTGNISIPIIAENLFGSVNGLTVTIQGGGTLSISNTTGSLLRIGGRQTVIARNITLRGRSGNNNAVIEIGSGSMFRMEEGALVTGNSGGGRDAGVFVNGGTFVMLGGAISGNGDRGYGGVHLGNGTFTMQGGAISGNTSYGSGGGVCVDNGTFTMQGGSISGNTSIGNVGGGVGMQGGTFIMQGGTISGNTCRGEYGGGVYVNIWNRATFTKTGGTIYGNDSSQNFSNTARSHGHAVYSNGTSKDSWRNATAGPDDNTAGYGFWLND